MILTGMSPIIYTYILYIFNDYLYKFKYFITF